MIDASRGVVIERVYPELDCGRYAVKREVGDSLKVTADIFKEGHDVIAAAIRYRPEDEEAWSEARMRFVDNDRWGGSFTLTRNARFEYTVIAWTDWFGSWSSDLRKKYEAGQELSSELLEGARLVELSRSLAKGEDATRLGQLFNQLADSTSPVNTRVAVAFSDDLLLLMERYPNRTDLTVYDRILPVQVDRERARFAAWYELFPRSMSDDPARHGTFDDVIAKLPYVRDMGFDVLYFPPIHPIGRAHRKGKNNSLVAREDEPGSPYAIGGEAGGHKAVHPELGTLQDFRRLVAAAAEQGMEIALDFAIQVSPDHPYVKEHPHWFFIRPDGTIKYAENPPKKYQDIYPLNFYGPGWEEQWEEWKSVFLFWVAQGVRIFRVDNPHTKPVQFWEWVIREVQREHPDVIFLAEAFTRPKMMRVLAKAGFTQSYTYFTWRNFKGELQEYFTELTRSEMREYYRGNLFPNTPDINPEFLQKGGRPAFIIRAVLAATLSSVYGIYSGFELCEAAALEGKEEYLDSEKYEIRAWDWDRPGNIRPLIRRLNEIRREHPALQEYDNLCFHLSDNDNVLFYEKSTADHEDLVFVAVNLDPFEAHEVTVLFPMDTIGVGEEDTWEAVEMLSGDRHLWRGSHQHMRIEPGSPARIWRVRRWGRSERDFEGFRG
ncbi:MAG: alpha-1,4-glucan--maltose-1-phosphate maltosyltransferase [Gemmatimonadota bacterium]|jgi:starch synthase (maltosyl-transferring)|nr:alpha-1,4-glucan--maltose-1-phosphate maltosyltransferase [Gemmatimonadota bacterium]